MKKVTAITLGLAAALAVNGCSKPKQKLYLYNWADYIDPEIVQQFEKEEGCEVIIDLFDDNESALAKLLAGAAGYDIIFPSTYSVPLLQKHNLVHKLDLGKLRNVLANFDYRYARFLNSANMEHSVPYAFSITGIAYRSDKSNGDVSSWNDLYRKEFTSRLCVLNDIREMIGIGLIANGCSANSTSKVEIAKAAEYAMRMKKAASKMDNVGYRTTLVSGETYCAIGYNSDVQQIMAESPDMPLKFAIPKEGSTCCFDEMAILESSTKKELAYKFINFIYRKDIAKKNAEYNCTFVPVEDANRIGLTEDELSRLHIIKDVGPSIELYNNAWDSVKSAK